MKLPEIYKKRMISLLGEEDANKYFQCFSKPGYSGIRINTKKISVEEYLAITPFHLTKVPWTTNGFYYDNSLEQPTKHPHYFAGLYYIQEPSAMTPSALLPVEPGDMILDMCAAPGGKSTELGSRLNGTGILYSNDISRSRARALLKNIELFGITNTVVLTEPPENLQKNMEGYFDKILIDAPCSGEGMFRKDNSIISNWEKLGTEYYAKIQRSIIVTGAKLLKPGGMMLYSTCTFSPQEDEESILHLLKQVPDMELIPLPHFEGFDTGHPEWSASPDEGLLNCRRLWPHKINGEGHFLALLHKKETSQQSSFGAYPYNKKGTLSLETKEFLSHVKKTFDSNRFEIYNGKCYYLPEHLADIRGLAILRCGIYLGDEKKQRFEPSTSFALSLKKGDFDQCVDFSSTDEKVIRYFKGETITIDNSDFKGYVLITVDGYGLGWAKANNGTLKNKYNTAWRWM